MVEVGCARGIVIGVILAIPLWALLSWTAIAVI